MKKIICVCILFVVLVLAGCSTPYQWEFAQEVSAVAAIRIVDAKNGYVYVTLKELDVSCADELYAEIKGLEFSKDTDGTAPFKTGFLIEFSNGEYDLITVEGADHYRYTDGKIKACDWEGIWTGVRCREPQKLEDLLERYMDQGG